MEGLLQNIRGVVVYLDDVLITGKTAGDHLNSLTMVLDKLQEAGLRLKRTKCSFMEKSVTYLGHKIDSDGLHPLSDAIKKAPAPTNVTQLKAYLGLVTYYARFIPNLSNVLHPLYRLLQRNVPWRWSATEELAFDKSKEHLTSPKLLVHFNPKLPLVLAVDASPYGVGAVLAHINERGEEQPIGYASRTLTVAESNYSQMEREGIACMFGTKKFHSYIYGRPFKLYTDNLALKTLFNESKPIPQQASGRIQRWALALANYEHEINFRPTHKHSNADDLSRLPLLEEAEETEAVPPELVLLIETMENLPITAEAIAEWTMKDSVLARVYKYTQRGWPMEIAAELRPYYNRRTELSTLKGCLLLGSRVIVPHQGQKQIVSELHHGHPGINRMKSLARMYVRWPRMEENIELVVKTCPSCQAQQKETPVVPLKPWKWPARPWTRVHVDYAGPFLGSMFLVIVDAYTKWVEIFRTNSSTSTTTIECLRNTFARFGLPQTLVSDNGPCFTSQEFKEFLMTNGITHLTTAPYHPQSNGLAEKMVQTFKSGMQKMTEGNVSVKLARFLLNYRTTPHSTTGITPAELMFGHRVRTRFDLLHPELDTVMENKQRQQKQFVTSRIRYCDGKQTKTTEAVFR